jgi:hypothetical protein
MLDVILYMDVHMYAGTEWTEIKVDKPRRKMGDMG